MVKAYFDASGKANDPGCKSITLACYTAPEEVWQALEPAWEEILKRFACPLSRNGTPYFHSKEAFHSRGEYAGWDRKKVWSLTCELFNVLGTQGRRDLIGFSCTVEKSAYAAVKQIIPALRPMDVMCVDHCFGNSLRHPRILDKQMQLFFDHDEPYEPILRRVRSEIVCGKHIWWFDSVASIERVSDSRDCFPLQAADLLAWAANRHFTYGPDSLYGVNLFIMAMMNGLCHVNYDTQEMLDTFALDGSYKGHGKPSKQQRIRAPRYAGSASPVVHGDPVA